LLDDRRGARGVAGEGRRRNEEEEEEERLPGAISFFLKTHGPKRASNRKLISVYNSS